MKFMSTKKLLNNWKKKTIAGLVGLIVVGGGIYINAEYTNPWYKWTHDESYVPARLPVSAFREGPEFIAHAGGMIDGTIYTNSREAVEQAIRLGHRFIELDLKATIGGELYGCHSKREFNARTGRKWLGHIPMTVGMVKSAKIDGRYTPIFLREVYELLKKHPDVYLVTDKVTDYAAIIEQFPLPDQLIVETFEPNQYYKALAKGIKYVTFAGSFEELVKSKATLAVVAPNAWNNPRIREWHAQGNTPMFLEQEDCDNIKLPVGTLAYSDTCRPKNY